MLQTFQIDDKLLLSSSEEKARLLATILQSKTLTRRLSTLRISPSEVFRFIETTVEDSPILFDQIKEVGIQFLLLQTALRRNFFCNYDEGTRSWGIGSGKSPAQFQSIFITHKDFPPLLAMSLIRHPDLELKQIRQSTLVLTDPKKKQTVTKREYSQKMKLDSKELDAAVWRLNESLKQFVFAKLVSLSQ
jgi:hypothetical protein